VALRQHELIEALKEESLTKDLFAALSRTPQRPGEVQPLAARLGIDLDAPNLVVHLVPRPEARAASHAWRDVLQFVATRIAGQIPGAAFEHREHSSRGLLPLRGRSPEEVLEVIRRAEAEVRGAAVPSISVGVSHPCRRAEDFPRAFREAEAAAEVGPLLLGGPVTSFDDLGPYRYVLERDAGRDRYQEPLERVAEYDRRRRTRLLGTLEAYLDRRGNAVATARALYIHPNTLRQRLERIERLTGLSLEHEDWLSLALAVKAVKLRRLRNDAGGADDG
jgi:DNA-binding PucR family transcriptional regulator